MLWIKTTHVFTVSNNAAVGIGDDHFFRISTRLDGLRNVLADGVACRISINGVKTRVVWLWRLSIIERIWLQVMPTWRSFIHICNLILIFLIIWRLNCLRDTINKFILLRKHKQKLKKQKKNLPIRWIILALCCYFPGLLNSSTGCSIRSCRRYCLWYRIRRFVTLHY